jgi:hypothetical protein
MNSTLCIPTKLLLQMLSHSIYGPWPASPEFDYPKSGPLQIEQPQSPGRTTRLLRLPSAHFGVRRRPAFSAIRMQVLRLLETVESLTHREAAQMLEIDPQIVLSQLAELQSLQLVECAGTCESDGRGHPLFSLNRSHPVLALLLGPAAR